jgi:hypothetical protein
MRADSTPFGGVTSESPQAHSSRSLLENGSLLTRKAWTGVGGYFATLDILHLHEARGLELAESARCQRLLSRSLERSCRRCRPRAGVVPDPRAAFGGAALGCGWPNLGVWSAQYGQDFRFVATRASLSCSTKGSLTQAIGFRHATLCGRERVSGRTADSCR